MHSSCNIQDVGKSELLEDKFNHTKYPIKLSYNAAKPGIISLFNHKHACIYGLLSSLRKDNNTALKN